MRRVSVEYYIARAKRERELARKAASWMAALHVQTAERYERWALQLSGQDFAPQPIRKRREPPIRLDTVTAVGSVEAEALA